MNFTLIAYESSYCDGRDRNCTESRLEIHYETDERKIANIWAESFHADTHYGIEFTLLLDGILEHRYEGDDYPKYHDAHQRIENMKDLRVEELRADAVRKKLEKDAALKLAAEEAERKKAEAVEKAERANYERLKNKYGS